MKNIVSQLRKILSCHSYDKKIQWTFFTGKRDDMTYRDRDITIRYFFEKKMK